MTPQECEKIIQENPEAFVALLQTKILPELSDLMDRLFLALPSLQIQQAAIDCKSMIIHLEDLEENGAEAPLKDIPLADSEIEENFIFPEDQEQLEFADDISNLPPIGAPFHGDIEDHQLEYPEKGMEK
jgi:hypothetical protein